MGSPGAQGKRGSRGLPGAPGPTGPSGKLTQREASASNGQQLGKDLLVNFGMLISNMAPRHGMHLTFPLTYKEELILKLFKVVYYSSVRPQMAIMNHSAAKERLDTNRLIITAGVKLKIYPYDLT